MRTLRLITVVGARPQFVKAAAVSKAIASFNRAGNGVQIIEEIVHTGQHYDDNLSKVFFDELGIPQPVATLKVAREVGPFYIMRIAGMMQDFSHFLDPRVSQNVGGFLRPRVSSDSLPDWVLTYGDTDSTYAGAYVAATLNVPIAHVEAGLRGGDMRVHEERNRKLTDHLSSLLFCPSVTSVQNLAAEGMRKGVYNTGDVMLDVMLDQPVVRERPPELPPCYYLATVHRAESTDDPERLKSIFSALEALERPVILPLHPRTRKALSEIPDLVHRHVCVLPPVSYRRMITLERYAQAIITDSGGIQKEAYWLKVPCVTMTDTDEWVELSAAGCNKVVGASREGILQAVAEFEESGFPSDVPEGLYGSGNAAEVIVAHLGALAK